MTESFIKKIIKDSDLLYTLIKTEGWMESIKDLWGIIEELKNVLERNIVKTSIHPSVKIPESCAIIDPVIIEKNVKIYPHVTLEGPTFIGEKSSIGPNSYIRRYSLLEKNVNIGYCAEIILSILLTGVKMRHYGFVGRSVIGRYCNLSAGFTTAVIRLDENKINLDEIYFERMGAIVGNHCKFGVGVKVMPGKVIGEKSFIWPNVVIFDSIPKFSDVKLIQEISTAKREGV